MGTRASDRRTNVLVLTSELELARLVRSILEPACKVTTATTPGANPTLTADSPNIIILDAGDVDLAALSPVMTFYPKAQVIAVCREYREADCIAVLELDADYLPRPFRALELAARVRVAELRRFNATGRRRYYRKGSLVLDLFNRRLAVEGRPIALAPFELALLTLLASQPGGLATYDRLLAELALVSPASGRRALRSRIFRLRRKIERDPLHPEILLAEAGVGYRLDLSNEEPPLRARDSSPIDQEWNGSLCLSPDSSSLSSPSD